ncbi:NACHT domain-containing protein [Actinoplanes sp. NPDC051343]|uniref:NACHT domain-containing protein n=1 Tax=Actinoplanes sp. NPDC051343 TaxID=3363906 RepID=UPI0037A41B77
MGPALSYHDAARMLGGDTAKIQKLVDVLIGAGMIALVGPFRDVLGWFDAKAELSKITEHLITGLVERQRSLSRHERSERLRAAHVVLVTAAFFEVLAEAEVPLDPGGLRLSPAEQQSLASRAARIAAAPAPGPAESHEEFRARLTGFYRELATVVTDFGSGLTVWEHLGPFALDQAKRTLADLAEPAVERFDSLLGRLAAEFPEVAFWAGIREHNAMHARLRDTTAGLAALGEVLEAIAVGRAPDDRRAGLARTYAAALDRPIAEAGEVPPGLRLPTLGRAFVAQAYRVAEVTGPAPLSSEDWWERRPARNDLLAFLTARLTSPELTAAPMLVLGQPGSGKSVLARVLSARLPAGDFLPVLVELRSVHAAADVQEQIEQAVRIDTGERVEWPALSRSAGEALPVLILDGFDELLQATGVSQTDYLLRVAAFQRREADQGRPVAVIVTSRISVADRAQAPEGAVAVRLEPFDRARVGAWLDMWNRTNAAEVDLETVLRYPDLAGQPLLLLMLAVYDAEGNSLRDVGTLRTDQLYERLLERFARREVEKRGAGLPVRDRDRRTELELRKLSVVAFAMFNRGAQWVTEDELDADLRALPGLAGGDPAGSPPAGLRAPIRAAELALGSFFFVHRARATRDGLGLSAFEFLHATFGEFLVARLIHRIVRDMVARERASTFATGVAVDDALLRALLSFAPLAGRRQVVAFVHGMAGDLSQEDRADWAGLLVRLFGAAQQPRPPDVFDAYLPGRLTVPARIAAHTSNLLILMLCTTDVTAGRLSGATEADDPYGIRTVRSWKELALLWHSQAGPSGWGGLLDHVQVDRVRRDRYRDVALSLRLDVPTTVPPVDMNWVLGVERPEEDALGDARTWMFLDEGRQVRRETHFSCDRTDDFQQHAVEPLHQAGMAYAGDLVYLPRGEAPVNVLGAFLRLQYDRELGRADRDALYRRAEAWTDEFPGAGELLLRCVELDRDADPHVVMEIVGVIVARDIDSRTREAVLRCILAHPGLAGHDNILSVVGPILDTHDWTDLHLEVAIRLCEQKVFRYFLSGDRAHRLIETYGKTRPDFASRIGILVDD